jgi:uncharacterized membrane protein YeaQ/YmgE (transglycosylase-associated protein family)
MTRTNPVTPRKEGLMTLLGFVLLLVVGAICGFVAEMIVGWSPGGFFASAAIGFVGAWLGSWLAGVLHLPPTFAVRVDGYGIDVIWTILGAILLLLVVSLFRRRPIYY